MELRELENFVIENGRVDKNVDGGWLASLEAEMEHEAEERGLALDAGEIKEWIYRIYGDDTTCPPRWGLTNFADVPDIEATVYANWRAADGGSLKFCRGRMYPVRMEYFETEADLKSRMSEISDEWFAISEED
jgi:hypothetical protein